MSGSTPSRTASLEALLAHPQLWCAGRVAPVTNASGTCTSGFPTLDARLPDGGWPRNALIEILHDDHGIGELSLLLPALARLDDGERLIACIAPPHVLCVAALMTHGLSPQRVLMVDVHARDEIFWAAEQALRSGACAAVLLWWYATQDNEASSVGRDRAQPAVSFTASRRLQLAAEDGSSLGVIFGPLRSAASPSAAALRLMLHGRGDHLQVSLLKARGARSARVQIAMDDLARPTP